MNRNLISALTLASLLAAPALAGNHGGPPPGSSVSPSSPHGGFHGGDPADVGARMAEHQSERLTRALDLTADQQQLLTDLQVNLGEAVRPIFESIRTTRDELEAALEAASPDATLVGTKAISMHQAKQAIEAAHDQFQAGIVAMLSEVQRAQFEALEEARPERGERFRRGPGHFGHHPQN